MIISKDTVVQFHYSLQDEKGEMIESTADNEPMAYLHGHNNMVPGLEKALEGKAAGDSFSVTIEPAEGYGLRKENAMQRIPLKHLQGARKWKPGMMAIVDTNEGYRQVTVVKVGKFNADVDTNHPLAGITLTFNVQVKNVREATADEIAHGHAHGDGGHQH